MIFSVIGQPDLRLVVQLLNIVATAVTMTRINANFFIVYVWVVII